MITLIRWIIIGLFAVSLTACNNPKQPGDPCVKEGDVIFYQTGKVLVCESGKWVLKKGHGLG